MCPRPPSGWGGSRRCSRWRSVCSCTRANSHLRHPPDACADYHEPGGSRLHYCHAEGFGERTAEKHASAVEHTAHVVVAHGPQQLNSTLQAMKLYHLFELPTAWAIATDHESHAWVRRAHCRHHLHQQVNALTVSQTVHHHHRQVRVGGRHICTSASSVVNRAGRDFATAADVGLAVALMSVARTRSLARVRRLAGRKLLGIHGIGNDVHQLWPHATAQH